MEPDSLPVKYIDIEDLKALLRELFGTNFEIDTSGANHVISTPRKLTPNEIKSIMKG